MELTTNVYKAYKDLVYDCTHEVSNKYNVDFDELLGYGMEIFCKAAQTFDPDYKVAFSTYLYNQLKDLQNKAKKENKQLFRFYLGVSNPQIDFDNSGVSPLIFNEGFFEEVLASIDLSFDKYSLLYDIAKSLSPDAQQYLTDLFNGVFERPKNPKGGAPEKFPVTRICDYYGWTKKEAVGIRHEICSWWGDYRMVG